MVDDESVLLVPVPEVPVPEVPVPEVPVPDVPVSEVPVPEVPVPKVLLLVGDAWFVVVESELSFDVSVLLVESLC